MGKNQISLVLGLVSALAIIAVSVYVTDSGHKATSCMDNIHDLADAITIECEW